MSTAAAQFENDDSRTPLPLRRDTFLGVFEAIGQDLGINPNWLRIPFAALILWNPEVIIGLYLALGLVVAASRWFFPAERKEQVHDASHGETAGDRVEDQVSEERLAA
jgi:phage shock protein PspC (stress-responsive transcriptional regulator)